MNKFRSNNNQNDMPEDMMRPVNKGQAQQQAQQMQLYPEMFQARIRTEQEVNNYQEQSKISNKESQDIFRPVLQRKESRCE